MSKIWVIHQKQLQVIIFSALLITVAAVYLNYANSEAAVAQPSEERTIPMVTGEFKTTTEDGKIIETYVWHPDTVYVKKGERIRLSISGVNGKSHPFLIEGMDIRGEVKKGKETIVRFTAEKEGIYRLICHTHHDLENGGPMVGYIVVD